MLTFTDSLRLRKAFNPDEPRDWHGKWTSGGDAGIMAGRRKPDKGTEEAETFPTGGMKKSEAQKLVAKYAKKFKFPPGNITVETGTKTFQLNGMTYNYAGAAFLNENRIVIYSDHTNADTLKALLAHEVMHIKYETLLNDEQEESKKVRSDPTPTREFMRPDGTLKSPYDEKYPLYDAYHKATEYWSRFHQTDGVTTYSKAWWQAANDGTATTKQAYHETLAEIARLREIPGGIRGFGDQRSWGRLYKLTNSHWDDYYKPGVEGQEAKPYVFNSYSYRWRDLWRGKRKAA